MAAVTPKRKRDGIQLCKMYQPGKASNPKSFLMEPKFDGIRGTITIRNGVATPLTSTGKPVYNVGHIIKAFEKKAKQLKSVDNHFFDGEFLNPKIGFDASSGLCRKHDYREGAEGINFYVWDYLTVEEKDTKTCKQPLSVRKAVLNVTIKRIHNPNIIEVEYEEGSTHEDIVRVATRYVSQGNEGIVIKDKNGNYEHKKSAAWLKWKPKDGGQATQLEGDMTITGAYEGKEGGKCEGTLGGFALIGYLQDDGNISPERVTDQDKEIICEAGSGFSDAERKLHWKEFHEGKLVGRVAEIRYDGLTEKGSLRFPTFYRMRDDKD